jgi:type III secretory pathway component EscV
LQSLFAKHEPLDIEQLSIHQAQDVRVIDSLQDKMSKQRKFDESLSEAIDEVLASLGAPIKKTVYFKLENDLNIRKNEIPQHIDEFTDFLYKTFGLGAPRVEIKCMENLNSKIKVNIKVTKDDWSVSKWTPEGMTFQKYVSSARNNYCNP